MGPRFLAGCFRIFTTKLATGMTLEWKPIDAVADIITQLTEELSFIKLYSSYEAYNAIDLLIWK